MAPIDDFARQRDESRKRLWLLMAGFAVLAVIVGIRLTYLQVLRSDDYRKQLDDWLILQPDYQPALRGNIHDCRGAILAEDVPSWQVEAYYGVLDSKPLPKSGRSGYVYYLARRLRRGGQMPIDVPLESTEEAVHQRIAESWQKIADLTGKPTWQLYKTADSIVDRVRTIREAAIQRHGYEADVEEQRQFHPILKDLPADQANQLRLDLAAYPWFRIHTSTSRQYADDPAICHVIGRLAEVPQADPDSNDDLHARRLGDRTGSSGIEYAAEDLLRGSHGKTQRNRGGDYLVNVEPLRGQDVHLTIDLAQQRWIYEQLGRVVHACPTASGASAVLLDVNTREVRAAVSWPGYTQQDYAEHYDKLAHNGVHRPLRFRALADTFAPGSIVKPVIGLAALASGVVTPTETITCTGYLFPGKNVFRCWTTSHGMPGHGPLTVQEGIVHSCDIVFYTLGRRLGVDRECQWFDLFGLGRSPGTGLLEEARGIVPTSEYLAGKYKRSLSQVELQSFAQNFGIGQGEVMLTPLQAANLAATVATGAWQPPVLLTEQAEASRAARRSLPGNAEVWRIIRRGMFGVVNDEAGTAHKYAYSQGVQIAGKTGTAETEPRKVSYTYELKMYDGTTQMLEVADPTEASDKIAQMGESVVKSGRKSTKYWPGPPDPEHKPTHAWFMGYAPAHNPQYALAVLIEYGGGGSAVAAPVSRDIFEYLFGVVSRHAVETPDPEPAD